MSSQPRVFISYRRSDTKALSRLIYQSLQKHFGERRVFFDVESIPLGQDFVDYLREQVTQCDVMLAVIGHNWLSGDKIFQVGDYVHIELLAAIEHEIPVIPIFAEGAKIPEPHQVPVSLRALLRFQGQHVDSGPDFDNQMQRVARHAERLATNRAAADDEESTAEGTPRVEPAGSEPAPSEHPVQASAMSVAAAAVPAPATTSVGWSLLRIAVVAGLLLLAVPLFGFVNAYISDRKRDAHDERLRALQRDAERVNERVELAAREECTRHNTASAQYNPPNETRVYHSNDECLGKDFWEKGRLTRRILYAPGQAYTSEQRGSCTRILAIDDFSYESELRAEAGWNTAKGKLRRYLDEGRRTFLEDHFTATGNLTLKEYCADGFAVSNTCSTGYRLEDDMRSSLPDPCVLLPGPLTFGPPFLY